MPILAVESSCDETSLALLSDEGRLIDSVVFSQIKTHRKYGGIIPEYASRMHTEKINSLFAALLKKTALTHRDISAVAVTRGPGLEGALLVGLAFAKTVASLLDVPILGVNHLHGHIYSAFLCEEPPQFPFVCLVVSGGHTLLLHVKNHLDFELLGQTRDDAVGESFDKVARALGLPYPGGPHVEKAAQEGNPKAMRFPRPMLRDGLEFSFSGLKTAVVQCLHSLEEPYPVADICASFQAAINDTVTGKALRACDQVNAKELVLCGGVAANQSLRNALEQACKKNGIRLTCPPFEFCTDNAAMIGMAGYMKQQHLGKEAMQWPAVKANLSVLDV